MPQLQETITPKAGGKVMKKGNRRRRHIWARKHIRKYATLLEKWGGSKRRKIELSEHIII